MDLLENIDDKKSRQNAKGVLKKYRHLCRIIGKKLTDNQDIQFLRNTENTLDISSDEKSDLVTKCRNEIVAIETSLQNIDKDCLEIIYYTYLSRESHTAVEISFLVFSTYNSVKTVERRLNSGLMQFCESYRHGKLLVLNN